MPTGKELFSLSHPETVLGVAFSPDGKRLATASNTPLIKVWDATSGEELLSFSGHIDSIMTIAFSPDGTRLATASRDGTGEIAPNTLADDGRMPEIFACGAMPSGTLK